MNTLSMAHRDYSITSQYNKKTSFWEVRFVNELMGDTDSHIHLTKIDIETLRDNAKRLYECLERALDDKEMI